MGTNDSCLSTAAVLHRTLPPQIKRLILICRGVRLRQLMGIILQECIGKAVLPEAAVLCALYTGHRGEAACCCRPHGSCRAQGSGADPEIYHGCAAQLYVTEVHVAKCQRISGMDGVMKSCR